MKIPEKKLGFGLMRLPLLDKNDSAQIDKEQVCQMVDRFIENGFTYFDTAWMYHNFHSEPAVKNCLVSRHPRESFTLATKLHFGFFDSLEDRDKIFNAQREKTGADYFDYYLLHGIDSDNLKKYEQFDCFSWLTEKKAQGLVRSIGFSFHDTADVLDRILTNHPEIEFVQLQINYLDWENEFVQSRACYETCVKHGKKVIVMEGVKGGTLARIPEKAENVLRSLDPSMSIPSWAIRFCASLENVMVVLSGMSSLEQLEDNMSYMKDFKPLTEDETNAVFKAADIIQHDTAIACTGCSYCTDGCPMNIAIPKYFSLYNMETLERNAGKSWTPNGDIYKDLCKSFGKASECVECGQCEGICPQHLPIIDSLKKVAELFE